MKIIFDARVFEKQMHGIARYGQNLLDRLLALDPENDYRVLIRFPEVKDWIRTDPRVTWLTVPVPPYTLREQWLVPWRLRGEPFDLFFSPTYILPRSLASRGILTIHDLIHLAFPAEYGRKYRGFYRWLVRPAVQRSRRVFTVSRSSKNDIIRYLGCPEEKIIITPNGVDPHWWASPPDSQVPAPGGLNREFILFVGNPRPHKNVFRVLEAFQELVREGSFSGILVVVGLSPGEMPSPPAERVRMLPHCSDPELRALYHAARLLAAPSLYEGFGLPVLEAMACGCPVLIGDRASLPEIAGPAGWVVDPTRVDSIREGMRRILLEPALREQRRKDGLTQARRYSWEETARTVLSVFQELAKK